MKPFFFDIETGGLGRESSIFSISFGKESVESLYAEPEKGSFISEWSEKQVWEPIRRLRDVSIESEQSILNKFLGKLQELPKGSTVAGWNVGYRGTGRGFDIPKLVERAEKHGLGQEYQQALGRLKVRDVGQEYAYRVAKEVSGREDLVERGLLPEQIFESARAYAKLGRQYEAGRPATEKQTARYLAEEFKNVAGWKQELAHKTFKRGTYQAHVSAADVASGIGLTSYLKQPKLFTGERQITRWGREAFYHSLVSQAMSPASYYQGEPEVPEEKYPRLMTAAREMEEKGGRAYKGFSQRVISGINEEVQRRGGDIADVLAGRGISKDIGRVWGEKSTTSPIAEAFGLDRLGGTAKSLWRHKVGIGIGVGATALYLSEPGSWFSSKEDANTIRGLQHGGEAQKLRRALTDFGSGYRGLAVLPEILQPLISKTGAYTGPTEEFTRILLGGIAGSGASFWQRLKMTKATLGFARQFKDSPYQHQIVVNPLGLEHVSKLLGGRYSRSQILKGTIKHERLHQKLVETGVRPSLQKLESIVPEGFKQFYKQEGLGRPEMITEEYLAYSKSFRGSQIPEQTRELFQPAHNLFSGKDDAWNTIKGLLHGGEAEKLRRILTDFGSGWDALRGLVRAGETFGKMTTSRAFQRSLKEAQVVRTLGEGMFGTVKEMKGMFRGKEFRFARKIGEIGEYETRAMRAVEGTVGPTLYRQTSGQLDMELFTGKTLGELTEKELSGVKQKHIVRVFGQLHKKGFVHGDPNLGNIMLVDAPGGTRLGLIDFGKAARRDVFDTSNDIRNALQGRTKLLGQLREPDIHVGSVVPQDPFAKSDPFAGQQMSLKDVVKNLPKTPLPIKRKITWYKKHKESMVMASSNAYRSGKRHTGSAGNIVR